MFCGACGKQITDSSRFCTHCGSPAVLPMPKMPVRVQAHPQTGNVPWGSWTVTPDPTPEVDHADPSPQ